MNHSQSNAKSTWWILTALTVSSLLLPGLAAISKDEQLTVRQAQALQAAEILDAKPQFTELFSFRTGRAISDAESDRLLACRVFLLRKVLLGFMEVRSACSKIDAELAYTYELSQRHQQKVDNINQTFNVANFIQGGALFTIEGRSKLHKQDKQSYILTCVGAGLSTALPALNIMHSKHNKTSTSAPRSRLHM